MNGKSRLKNYLIIIAVVFFLNLVPVATGSCVAPTNAIEAENCKPGNPQSEWDITGAGDPSIQGFATDISYNIGSTVQFKINTTASAYTVDIYRMGYYGGLGGRKVASLQPSVPLPQSQPACVTDTSAGLGGSGLADCGNWAVSASWQMPGDTVSGIYVALLTRSDTHGQSHIIFIVRNEGSHSDLLFQTSDLSWEAYNYYGLGSVYGSNTGDESESDRAFKVSYNRPFLTRDQHGYSWFFEAEYPMLRWLEANGYDVSYFSGVDAARFGSLILNHKTFLSVGHDEYWSVDQRTNVEAARASGVNLAFFSGNEVFWKTRWENSIDGSNTPYRTLVVYKDTLANALLDPPNGTGTWRDPRFGGLPENALTGTLFMVNGAQCSSIQVPAEDGNLRFWRNTSAAGQANGQTIALPVSSLGFEWDVDADNGFRPAGLFDLSNATYAVSGLYLLDLGSKYGNGTATHHMTMYRAASGALVFGAGTILWPWGLDSTHDVVTCPTFPADARMQQATVNLLADMGAQPATLQPGIVNASASTDKSAPSSIIAFPTATSSVHAGTGTVIAGTASDVGGAVGGVEISVDGGATWHPASGRSNWSYTWTPTSVGTTAIQSRAVDDSGNLESASTGISVNVQPRLCPCSALDSSQPGTLASGDSNSLEVGVKFRSDVNGFVTGIRFYKGSSNTGTHVGNLWSTDGTLLASATFVAETASGWQQVTFSSAVAITANVTYIASYFAPAGHYSLDLNFFATSGLDSTPLHFLRNGVDGPNGVYAYSATSRFPNSSFSASNYWVDVVLVTGTIVAVTPPQRQKAVSAATSVSATFDRPLDATTVNGTTFQLLDQFGAVVPAVVTYDSGSFVATLTPTSLLRSAASYTAMITGNGGGVTDSSGTPLGFNLSWRFTTCCSGWTADIVPGMSASTDALPVELGIKFRSDVSGFVTGIRFYKGPGNTGTHVGNLWAGDGTLLATGTFGDETASGWQELTFSSAIAIAAGTTYIASYFAPNGHYALDQDYFTNSGFDTPPLHLLQSGIDGANGVYTYSSGSAFPASTYHASNYWVDVVFIKTLGGAAGPSVTAISPSPAEKNVSVTSSTTAAFSKALDASTVASNNFQLFDSSNAPVPSSVLYDPASLTATLHSTYGLDFGTSYQVMLVGGSTGVKDMSGNAMTSSLSWSFSTEAAPAGSCPCSGLTASVIPSVIDSGDPSSTELGVKFRSDVAGFVTSIRFYKGSGNTGTHIGHLWTADGRLIASATFSGETASGWQKVTFANAVAIAAGTTYIASYFAANGHYSVDQAYFASTGAGNAPLHLLQNGIDGPNGVFAYGASGTFPASTFQSSNYWVDVIFTTNIGGVFGPTVTTVTPNSASAGVNVSTAVTAAFSKAINPASVNSQTFQLLDASGNPISASINYDSDTFAATLLPASPLNLSSSYRAVIKGQVGGVTDASSNPMRSGVTWLFSTQPPPSGSCPCSVWTAVAGPSVVDSNDAAAVELGVKLRSDTNGSLTGVRFYKSLANTGTHVAHLWKSDGTLLASATFSNETASGWQQVTLTSPVPIVAGQTYVVSYFAPNGHYSVDQSYFATSGMDNPPLHLLQNGVDGANGVFTYGASGGFPTSSFGASNYWIDAVFETGPPAPTVASVAPANGNSNVNPGTKVTVQFSMPMDPASISTGTVLLIDQFNSVVPATITYDSALNTATLSPTSLLSGRSTYTGLIKGGTTDPRAKNLAGTSLATNFTWSFSTAAELASLSITPSAVAGGTSATASVTLAAAAPAGDLVVQLSSNNPAIASVPASITVPGGATSATFSVSTSAVSSNTAVTIAASYDATKTVVLTVNAPVVSGVALNPTSVLGGNSSTGTVTLASKAPASGAVVTLSSNNTAIATVPASITIAGGSTSGTFTVSTSGVASPTGVTISATYNGVQSAVLTVTNAVNSTLTLSPTSVPSGNTSTGTVTLTGIAPSGGAVVTLSSANAGVASVPPTVTVAAGASTATFTVTTFSVSANTVVAISSSYLGLTKSANLTVTAAALSSVTLSPATLVGGNSSTGTVTLNGIAPDIGAVVTLTTTNAAATIPASVTVPAGAKTATFAITTAPVTAATTGTVSGTYRVTKSANLTVNPPALSTLALSPNALAGGNQSIGTVTLTGVAAADITVTLSSNNAAATVPATVVVPAGSASATFAINTSIVTANTAVTISAVYNAVTRNATLTVRPPRVASVTLNPSTVRAGTSSVGTVTLDGPAVSTGTPVTLSSSATAVATFVDGNGKAITSVTVPAGQTTATFGIVTKAVVSTTAVTISATRVVTQTATLTVTP